MKAIIMAGGEGTRLRPVSGETPKPLVPLLGRSMMEHIIILLRDNGFDDICVTLRYKAEMICAAFGDGSSLGVKLQYRLENEPCGTAGGVKNCEDFCRGEDFLVISGDAACDFDLRGLMKRHRERRAAATLALCRCSEPLRYGLALTAEDGRIRAFIEKPDWPEVVTDTVNTGIYVLSPAAMSLIPQGKFYDFGKDLFPEMLRRGMFLLGVTMDGYWCDVGTPLSYYKCCLDALEGRLKLNMAPEFRIAAAAKQNVTEKPALEYPCRDRAALMGKVSAALMDYSPQLQGGLLLHTKSCELRISPSPTVSALRIFTSSPDAEFAREFAETTLKLIKALDE